MRLIHLLRIIPFIVPVTCVAEPEALPEADPQPEAEAQTYENNAPFSGAIYIVNSDGQAVTAAGANMCPSYASLSCGNMGQPSWCCPSGYTCAAPANSDGIIGCCPSGSSCGGSVNVASVTTVTVYGAQQTSVVYVQPAPTTVMVYNQPTTVAVYNPATVQQAAGGYCQTLTMVGPTLPTTRQGECGTILIVPPSEGTPNFRAIGYGMGGALLLLHLMFGRMFHWI